MFIRNELDILNHKYSINEHPDNTELENWLSWLHIPTVNSYNKIADITYRIDQLKLELSVLRGKIFKSLSSEDYPTLKAKKAIVENRPEIIKIKDDIESLENNELKIAEIIKHKYDGRKGLVFNLSTMRANTSNFEENIDWVVKQNRQCRR